MLRSTSVEVVAVAESSEETAENARLPEPPVTKYKLTVTIRGNSHDEIVDELLTMTRGGYLLASDYYKRDAFDSTGGRDRMVLEHTNPDMTAEQYAADLTAWSEARKEYRRG